MDCFQDIDMAIKKKSRKLSLHQRAAHGKFFIEVKFFMPGIPGIFKIIDFILRINF